MLGAKKRINWYIFLMDRWRVKISTNDFVYLLSCVFSFAKKEECMVTKVIFGTMDATNEGEIVVRNIEGIKWNWNLSDIKLSAVGSKLEIYCCGKKVVL